MNHIREEQYKRNQTDILELKNYHLNDKKTTDRVQLQFCSFVLSETKWSMTYNMWYLSVNMKNKMWTSKEKCTEPRYNLGHPHGDSYENRGYRSRGRSQKTERIFEDMMAEFFPLWRVKGINKFKSLKALLNQRKNIIHGEKHLKKKKKKKQNHTSPSTRNSMQELTLFEYWMLIKLRFLSYKYSYHQT